MPSFQPHVTCQVYNLSGMLYVFTINKNEHSLGVLGGKEKTKQENILPGQIVHIWKALTEWVQIVAHSHFFPHSIA